MSMEVKGIEQLRSSMEEKNRNAMDDMNNYIDGKTDRLKDETINNFPELLNTICEQRVAKEVSEKIKLPKDAKKVEIIYIDK